MIRSFSCDHSLTRCPARCGCSCATCLFRAARLNSRGLRPSALRSPARRRSGWKTACSSWKRRARSGPPRSGARAGPTSTGCGYYSTTRRSSASRCEAFRITNHQSPINNLMRESVIVSAVRTPTGKFLGVLKGFTAPELGAMVVREAVRRAGIDPQIVDECIMGNVVSAGLGQSPARQAALRGGLPDHVAALTINKVCGSALKAVMLADQGIRAGDIDVAVAGGMESMSNCPYLLPRVREGLRMGNSEVVDSMINDGLWCSFEQCHMGNAGATIAERYNVGREAQDDYAARSHQKAARATDEGAFKDEILPIEIPQKKGAPLVVDRDEPIRPDTTAESLKALKPAFKKDGTVTAGNAPGVNDGASALVVMDAERAKSLGLTPLARI